MRFVSIVNFEPSETIKAEIIWSLCTGSAYSLNDSIMLGIEPVKLVVNSEMPFYLTQVLVK